MPAVSVILPFRNAEAYLAEAVESILAQDFVDFELLAIDDGSQDTSVGIIEAIARRDPRVRLLRAGGGGLPAALNAGIREARGRFIARMDGDDVALPQRFGLQVAALERNPRLLVVGSAVEQIDRAGRLIDVAWFPSAPETIRVVLSSGRCCLCHPATMIRRDALLEVGGYRTSVPLTEDFDLWLRLSRMGDLANLDHRLLRYRLHPGSVAFHRTREQLTSLLRSAVLARNGLSADERAAVEACTEVETLIAWLRPGCDTSEMLVEMADWYVENAAVIGEHGVARGLAALLAGLVTADRRRLVERRLRQTAALTTAYRGHQLAAMRYLLGAGHDRKHDLSLWRSILSPPRLEIRQRDPDRAASAAGHLDAVHAHEDGSHLLLFGWFPIIHGRLPRTVALVLPSPGPKGPGLRECGVRAASLRLMRRFDVARAVGASHLYTGFRIEAALHRPIDLNERKPRVWSRSFFGVWRPLSDEHVVLDAPGMG